MMKDSEFLEWIHSRLKDVYAEDPYLDYMWRLRDVISRVKQVEQLVLTYRIFASEEK